MQFLLPGPSSPQSDLYTFFSVGKPNFRQEDSNAEIEAVHVLRVHRRGAPRSKKKHFLLIHSLRLRHYSAELVRPINFGPCLAFNSVEFCSFVSCLLGLSVCLCRTDGRT